MGAKQSVISGGQARTQSSSNDPASGVGELMLRVANSNNANGPDARQRARSLSSVTGQPIGIPAANAVQTGLGTGSAIGGGVTSADESSASSADDGGHLAGVNAALVSRVFAASSLPAQLWSFNNGIKCPVCSKFVLPDDIEYHLVVCLTKPCITYNEDVLTDNKGECVICLDDLKQGDTIARLPCLCIYHKGCIDSWFEVNRSCPEHPLD